MTEGRGGLGVEDVQLLEVTQGTRVKEASRILFSLRGLLAGGAGQWGTGGDEWGWWWIVHVGMPGLRMAVAQPRGDFLWTKVKLPKRLCPIPSLETPVLSVFLGYLFKIRIPRPLLWRIWSSRFGEAPRDASDEGSYGNMELCKPRPVPCLDGWPTPHSWYIQDWTVDFSPDCSSTHVLHIHPWYQHLPLNLGVLSFSHQQTMPALPTTSSFLHSDCVVQATFTSHLDYRNSPMGLPASSVCLPQYILNTAARESSKMNIGSGLSPASNFPVVSHLIQD